MDWHRSFVYKGYRFQTRLSWTGIEVLYIKDTGFRQGLSWTGIEVLFIKDTGFRQGYHGLA